MRASQFYFGTSKNTFAQAELVSHQLMLKAGFIRQLGSGLYTWLPAGLRVLKKVEAIVREEMMGIACLEVSMPCIQPADLWKESGRWTLFGPQMLKMRDRHDRDFCFGPTHEEVITDLVRREVSSYKALPLSFFQIQTKFRDELRPRFGVMRSREFLMKDAYSFHRTESCLQAHYAHFYEAYVRIFTRIGLKFKIVQADNGAIGGSVSHEFHALSDAGEDILLYHDNSDFAVNQELAEVAAPSVARLTPRLACSCLDTLPDNMTSVRLFFFQIEEIGLVCVVMSACHILNEVKLSRFAHNRSCVALSEQSLAQWDLGPKPNLRDLPEEVSIWADAYAATLSDFACEVFSGSSTTYCTGLNWGRDLPEPSQIGDFRLASAGDLSPLGQEYQMCRGIEVGHVFQLGTKYSESMSCLIADVEGAHAPFMGCYGIGVSRIVAAAIEQENDARGMIFSEAIAPFSCALVVLYDESESEVLVAAEGLYAELRAAGIDVLLDDRLGRPGSRFADIDLLGIPHRLVLNRRLLNEGRVEYKHRKSQEVFLHDMALWSEWLTEYLV